ncbi:MAG: hypothetical protein JZU52_02395, partial [Lamprocystis purpurea]|nr:hypothetical protein [Lamprocystis purpurea]
APCTPARPRTSIRTPDSVIPAGCRNPGSIWHNTATAIVLYDLNLAELFATDRGVPVAIFLHSGQFAPDLRRDRETAADLNF